MVCVKSCYSRNTFKPDKSLNVFEYKQNISIKCVKKSSAIHWLSLMILTSLVFSAVSFFLVLLLLTKYMRSVSCAYFINTQHSTVSVIQIGWRLICPMTKSVCSSWIHMHTVALPDALRSYQGRYNIWHQISLCATYCPAVWWLRYIAGAC